MKRELITEIVQTHSGNRTRTAGALGLQRTYLLRLIRKFEISVPVSERRRHNSHNGD